MINEMPLSFEMVNALKNIPEDPYLSSTLRGKKSHSRCNVLLLDDDYEYILILSKYLASPEVEVHIESDFWDAVTKYDMNQFDFIVSDIKMPKASGFEVYEYAKNYLVDTKIILLTSMYSEEVVRLIPQNHSYRVKCPIIYKSKGISHVCKEIRNELRSWYDLQADKKLIKFLKSLRRRKKVVAN